MRAFTVASAVAGGLVLSMLLTLQTSDDVTAHGDVRADATTPCGLSLTSTVSSAIACEPIQVRGVISTACATPRVNIVFVLPRPGVGGIPGAARFMEDVTTGVLTSLMERPVDLRAGVVEYDGHSPATLTPLTSDLDRVRARFVQLRGPGVVTNLPLAQLRLAVTMLEQARSEHPTATEVIVLWAGMKHILSSDISLWGRIVQTLNNSAIYTTIACGYERSCQYIRELLPRKSTYAEPPKSATLIDGASAYVDSELVNAPVADALSATVVVPQGLTYVDGEPGPTVRLSQRATALDWWLEAATGPVTFSYTVRSEAAGRWPVTTTVTLTDTLGATAAVTDSLQLVQGESCLTPTETPYPSVTPYPTSIWTVTPESHVTYLPVALHEQSCWRRQALDVVLVLDTSSSMLEERPTKLSRATEAIGGFAESLKTADQVALVTFDSSARVVQPLTHSHGSLRDTFAGLTNGITTRIDLGIVVAHEELLSPRANPSARKVMIVLTDGLPNPVGPNEVLSRADAAKGDGVLLLTIGLGAKVDYGLLRALASEPSLYFDAPTADDLEAIYRSLLTSLPCDEARYWGRR